MSCAGTSEALMSDEIFSSVFFQQTEHEEDDVPTTDNEISSCLTDSVATFIRSTECIDEFTNYSSFLAALANISCILNGANDDIEIKWFPRYKCAVVAKKFHGCSFAPLRNLTLVGLEKWYMDVQHAADNSTNKTSRGDGFASCPLPPVPDAVYENLWNLVEEEFSTLYQKDKKQGLGRHKDLSPAYMELVLKNACKNLLESIENRGGSVDSPDTVCKSKLSGGWLNISCHNGGEWPLLQAVIEHLLSYAPLADNFSPSLYQSFVCHFELFLLTSEVKQLLPEIQNSSSTPGNVISYIDKLMIMMISVARKAARLTEFYNMEKLEVRLLDLQGKLQETFNTRMKAISDTYQLLTKVKTTPLDKVCPEVDLTGIPPITGELESLVERREIAVMNIDLFPVSKNATNVLNLLLNHQCATNITVIYLAIRAIESRVFPLALKLDQSNLSLNEEILEDYANRYRYWNKCLIDRLSKDEWGSCKSVLKVELLSRETLIMWIIFCVIHKCMKEKVPLIAEYGIALNWKNVKHFVFSDKTAQTASLHVSSYIHQNTNKKPLFTLNDQSWTLKFAAQYTSESMYFQNLWNKENAAAIIRKDDHWTKVEQKQQQVRQLEKELADHESMKKKLEQKESELPYAHPNRIKIHNKVEELTYDIHNTKNSIQRARKSPPPLYQPLPSRKEHALTFLFFLHMPEDIQRLSRMCVASQQMLVPSEQWIHYTALEETKLAEINKSIETDTNQFENVCSYYNDHSPSKQSVCKVFHPFSETKVPKGSWIGPKDVMDFSNSSQGVYNPDNLPLLLFWNGGFEMDMRTTFFNPFAHTATEETVEYFTEKTEKSIQYTFTQYGKETKLDRGNRPIAKQRFKPTWLQKPQWLAFATLRAFPNQQLRRLCAIIRNRSLPLDNPIVHDIIRQTLYHTGDVEKIATGGKMKPLWKWDLIEGDFCEVMLNELDSLCDELSERPSNYASLLILIQIANYVSQWQQKCLRLTSRCIEVIKAWIKETNEQIKKADPKNVPALRARKGIFYHQALLCYSEGELNRDEACDMCQLLVHAQNDSRFQEETPFDEQLRVMINMRNHLMIKRSFLLRKIISDDSHRILSEAMKVALYETPPDLDWKMMRYDENNDSSSCYQAEDDNGNVYNINLLNGVVLYNGAPLSSLPSSILHHPLYKRSFGDRDFETCASGNLVKTVMPVKGCLYSFIRQRQDLVVLEKDINTNTELRQLNSLALLKKNSWGPDIPVIMKTKYSHWFCAERKVILFRQRYFCNRNVEFIMKQSSNGAWKCYRIPLHLTGKIWKKYLQGSIKLNRNFDHLVLNRLPALSILSKFENLAFIHTFLSPCAELKIHFPRFDLEFQTSDPFQSQFKSRDYAGYSLCANQQLADTLPHFRQYLVLEDNDQQSDMKIIVPQGKVSKNSDGEIIVQTEGNTDSTLQVFTYQIHNRFHNLQANSICARLHLAELYATTGSLLPDQRTHMTGHQTAMQLVRRCWTNKPLTDVEYQKLNALSKNCFGVPALSLVCYELACSSQKTAFIYPGLERLSFEFPRDFAEEYMQETYPWNTRSSLTSEEELRVLGHTRQPRSNYINRLVGFKYARNQNEPNHYVDSKRMNLAKTEIDDVTEIAEDCLTNHGALLSSYLKAVRKNPKDFPLHYNDKKYCGETSSSKSIHSFMIEELQMSHSVYNQQPFTKIKHDLKELRVSFKNIYQDLIQKRIKLEGLVFKVLSYIPLSLGPHALSYRILQSVKIVPDQTYDDLLKCAINMEWIKRLNPYLPDTSVKATWRQILLWLKLCSLEDKMKRLLHLCQEVKGMPSKANELQVIQELGVHRSWSEETHPQWLVFEVIAQIQIRPVQYTVAQSMIEAIDNDICNPVTQLNMGEGKTRVILPMLVMHWQSSKRLVRLNFLLPLLQEAWDYLHCILCASVFSVKLFHLPFSRDIQLTFNKSQTIISSLSDCKESRGIVLVCPEHRLSLNLKRIELLKENSLAISENLNQLDKFDFLDILDEVDEILRIKNKLVYAMGSQEHLPSKESRWNVIQALLSILWTSEPIKDILEEPLVSQRGKKIQGIYELRLIPGDAFDQVKENFVSTLLTELIFNPPFELRWLEHIENKLDVVKKFVTDPGEISLPITLDPTQMSDILTLRGLLANDIFFHCLMKRNRVDYGINHSSHKKLMAVPFKACETPSLRAEFGHPEVSLMYTCLAYYYDGLNEQQVQEAFSTLQLLGATAQSVIYKTWYDLSRPWMTASHKRLLNCIQKIDLTNTILVSLLIKYFCHNRLLINFWLNSCVFPSETMQFPHRLEASAWDIATNCKEQVAGFSGTNDDRIIIPTPLKWIEQKDRALIATDGKMLHLLKKSQFEQVTTASNVSQWISALDFVIKKVGQDTSHRTCALIDAGALMAGAPSNADVAIYLAKHLHRGIIYFDIQKNGWWVRDKFGRSWPKHSSPIHERDGFVYFDESRTRGADMKLNSNSHAVLTLGPAMCKDKLMQAAGRMRMLEQGQQVLLVAADDVTAKIRHHNRLISAAPIKSQHILEWVMWNTVQNISKWFPEWAMQGVHFVSKCSFPETAFIPDLRPLEEMYGCCLKGERMTEIIQKKLSTLYSMLFNAKNKEKILSHSSQQIFHNINERVKKYGQQIETKTGGNIDEECERELEKEIELEKVVERQIGEQNSRLEEEWDIQQFMITGDHNLLPTMYSLVVAISQYEPISNNLNWSESIYCTQNFFQACERKRNSGNSVNDYLRTVDSYLFSTQVLGPGHEHPIILLSEMECDKLLELAWKMPASTKYLLFNWSYTRRKINRDKIAFQFPPNYENYSGVSNDHLAVLDLFQGEVMFPDEGVKRSVQKMLTSTSAKHVAPLFCKMRGMALKYPRSDLEMICTTFPSGSA